MARAEEGEEELHPQFPPGDDDTYKAVVEASLQGVVILQDWWVVFANPAMSQLTGYSNEELLAFEPAAMQENIHPADRSRVEQPLFTRAMRGEEVERTEFRIRRKDGGWVWVESTAALIQFEGRPALEVSYIDAEERKRAEQRLRESERRFTSVFLSSPNPTLITSLEDGRIIDMNESMARATGESREVMVGRSARDLDIFVDLRDLPEALRRLRKDGELSGLEMPFRTQDGQIRHGIVYAGEVTLEDERCVIWEGSDVTSLKLTQDALRDSEARFRVLTESASEYVTEVDGKGDIIYLSPTFTDHLGWERADFLGRPSADVLKELAHPEDRERLLGMFADGLGGTQMGPVVSRVRSRSGEWRWIETVGRSINTSDGDTHLVTVARDVSERVRAQEERRRLQERVLQAEKLEGLGVLAGGIAHDFNNLLVGIQGNAELAVMSLTDEHPAHELLDQLQLASERAAGLTRELLAYAGKARFSVEAADLATLTSEMTGLVARSVAPGVRLELTPGEEPCWVEADVTQVGQVVLNLIKNAAEALPDETGVVEVRTGSAHLDRAELARCLVSDGVVPGRFAWLEVRDHGCGMDAQTAKRVFDPFFTTKFQGRGLGLAGVVGIVRGHRGTLSVDTALGRGTTFRVYLPQIDPPAGPAAPEHPPEDEAREAGTVLVIDDEPAVRAVSRRMLESAGYRVCAVASGKEGVDLARRHAAELAAVLLDLTMPGMDGDAVFSALRRIRDDLPVVFTSGHSEEDMARRLEGRTRVATLPKPFRLDDLIERIRSVAGD